MNDSPQLLVDAEGAARALGIKERTLHKLREREDFRRICPEVRLGPRATRWRIADLDAFARSIASSERVPEPPQLAASRQRRGIAAAGRV